MQTSSIKTLADYLKTMIEKYDALIEEGLIVIDGDREIDIITSDIVNRGVEVYDYIETKFAGNLEGSIK